MGFAKATRVHYWKVLIQCLVKNPRALRNAVSLMALYLHFGPFRDFVMKRLDEELAALEKEGDPRTRAGAGAIKLGSAALIALA